MKQIRYLFIFSLFLYCYTAPAQAMPQLVIDPTGQSPILTPAGWNVVVSESNGIAELAITENPDDPSTPQIGMLIIPPNVGFNALNCLDQIASLVNNRKDVQAINTPPLYGLIVEGKVNTIDVKMGILTTTNQMTGQVIGTYFVAPKDRFELLGGERLLVAVNQMGYNPFEQGALSNTVAISQNIDVYGYDAQMALLGAKRASPTEWIVGEWENGVGAPLGEYENIYTGAIHNASIGRGNFFKFDANGTYTFIRNYSISDGMGDSQFTAVEEGTYRFDGWNLTLKPTRFDASIQALSGKPTKWSGKASKERTYAAAIHPSQQGLVISGPCPIYGTSSSPGCVGAQNETMREGLLRK